MPYVGRNLKLITTRAGEKEEICINSEAFRTPRAKSDDLCALRLRARSAQRERHRHCHFV